MSNSEIGPRAAGTSLAAGGALLAGVLVLHGPLQPTLADQMHAIEERTLWPILHWAAAGALSLFAVTGLIVLSAGSRLTSTVATTMAWAVLVVGALWTMVTAVAEATALTGAAVAGSQAVFEAWWVFSEGMANGFAFLALAVAAIAVHEARGPERAVPPWSAWIAAAAGIAAFAGWVLGSWIGFAPGSLLWVASSLVMSLWLFWFGLGLALSGAGSTAQQPSPTRA